MTQDRFNEGFASLCIAFGKRADDAVAGVYYVALNEIADSDWPCVVKRAIQEREFFPPPVVLLNLAGELYRQRPQLQPEGEAEKLAESHARLKILWGKFDPPREMPVFEPRVNHESR